MNDWNTWTSKFNRFIRIPFFTDKNLVSLYRLLMAGSIIRKSKDLIRYDVTVCKCNIGIYLYTSTVSSSIHIRKRPDIFEIELSVTRKCGAYKYKNYYIKSFNDIDKILSMITDINEQIRTF